MILKLLTMILMVTAAEHWEYFVCVFYTLNRLDRQNIPYYTYVYIYI